jgi:hypothetical protein
MYSERSLEQSRLEDTNWKMFFASLALFDPLYLDRAEVLGDSADLLLV